MIYHIVPQIHPPPLFATLALVQSVGGGCTRDVTFSLAITPSVDRECLALLWMLASFLRCHSTTETFNLCSSFDEEGGRRAQSARQKDATDASGRLASFSGEGQESGALPHGVG